MTYVAIIEDEHGTELQRYPLEGGDLMDCDAYAGRWAAECERKVAYGKRTPAGLGDFTVTITDQPGGVRNWDSQAYFYEGEE